jgi:hypothetical protein
MAVEHTSDISFEDFNKWALAQNWFCVRQEEHDFGKKFDSAPKYDKTDIGFCYSYLTPSGSLVIVIVKDEKIAAVGDYHNRSD